MTRKTNGSGWSATKCRKKWNTKILKTHYLWCKKEGRDISWYDGSRKQFLSVYIRFLNCCMRSRYVVVNFMNECLIDKQGKKWVISGYYFDGDMSWTILIAADGSGKSKRVKGVI